jgi:flagellar motor component MotA
LSDFNGSCVFSTDFRKTLEYQFLMKISPVGAELFHAERQTDMTKVIVALYSFANAAKNGGVFSLNFGRGPSFPLGTGYEWDEKKNKLVSCSLNKSKKHEMQVSSSQKEQKKLTFVRDIFVPSSGGTCIVRDPLRCTL